MTENPVDLEDLQYTQELSQMSKADLIAVRMSAIAAGDHKRMAIADSAAVGRFMDAWLAGEFG